SGRPSVAAAWVAGRQWPVIGRQPSEAGRRSSVVGRQWPVAGLRSPAIGGRSPVLQFVIIDRRAQQIRWLRQPGSDGDHVILKRGYFFTVRVSSMIVRTRISYGADPFSEATLSPEPCASLTPPFSYHVLAASKRYLRSL